MAAYPIQIPKERLTDFCRRHCIRKLSLFGSVLREDFGPESDVDVLARRGMLGLRLRLAACGAPSVYSVGSLISWRLNGARVVR